MAYFEQARTVSTAVEAGFGHVVEEQSDGRVFVSRGHRWVQSPMDHEEWLMLPERDDVSCRVCKRQTVTIYRDVVSCLCGERWRWPTLVGGG